MNSKRWVVAGALLLTHYFSYSQISSGGFTTSFNGSAPGAGNYLTDFRGNTIPANLSNIDIQGTPFLNDSWSRGQIIIESGKPYDVAQMRFNILMNRVEYQNNGQAFEISTPFKEFTLYNPTPEGVIVAKIFKNNFPPIDRQNEKSFYEVVFDGKTKLLKYYEITTSEHTDPLTMVRIKSYDNSSTLYIYTHTNNALTKAIKRKSEFLKIFIDKQELVDKFMNENNYKKNLSESEMIKVCEFYSSL